MVVSFQANASPDVYEVIAGAGQQVAAVRPEWYFCSVKRAEIDK
jgi:hypothetical protein